MRSERRLTRRTLLASSFGLAMGGLAGCSQASSSTPTSTSPIVGTSFEGTDLVVSLREGHDLNQLNLIGPDGELFAATDVAVGATTVRLEILRIEPGSRMKHYTPGVHSLVAVSENDEQTVEIEMEPSLRVTDVDQYRKGDGAANLGRLAVTVENVGTGPTWVYDVTYQNAPNWAANNQLVTEVGAPVLVGLNEASALVVIPGLTLTAIGPGSPLLFRERSDTPCTGSVEFRVIIGVADGTRIEHRIRTSLSGEQISVGLTDQYVCSEIEVGDTDEDNE